MQNYLFKALNHHRLVKRHWSLSVTRMSACAHCKKTTEKLKCSKCRCVVYCSATCQKADWEKHKTSCKPSLTYVSEQVTTLHKSQQWRKLLLKWSSYIDKLLGVSKDDEQRRTVLTIFKYANQMGSNTTNDPVYSSALVPILQKLIEFDGSVNRFEAQGLHLCELGQSFCFLDNDIEEMECYLRATDIGDTHGIATVKCAGNLGIGRIFVRNNRVLEAQKMLRLALEAVESGNTDWMKQHALMCADELCSVLFLTNSIDEIGPIVKRFPKLQEKALEHSSQRLHNYHMRGHILFARFYEAKNRPEEAKNEIYKMLALIDANKECIHDFRPLFIHLIDQAVDNLRILDDTDIGDLQLAKAVYGLRRKQMEKDARWSSE